MCVDIYDTCCVGRSKIMNLLYYSRYIDQLKNARGRGIPFLFTYKQWLRWWEANLGPDWFDKRGAKHGQYVMARYGDVGPYHPTNVYCDFSHANCAHKGEKNGFARLNEATVRKIYLAHGSITSIAKKYGTNYHTVWDIKTSRYWSHVTRDLGPAPMKKQLTEEQVIAIYQSKEHYKVVAK